MTRQEHMLATAARLFRERGFAATSIRDLGDAMGLTSAALYHHFAGKEALLVAVVCEGLRRLRAAVQRAVDAEADLYAKVRHGLRAHLVTCLAHQDFAAVVAAPPPHGLQPDARGRIVALRDGYEALWADLLQRGQAAGLVHPDADLHLVRLLGFGAMNGVLTWYRPDGPHTPEQIADTFLALFSEGVLLPQPTA